MYVCMHACMYVYTNTNTKDHTHLTYFCISTHMLLRKQAVGYMQTAEHVNADVHTHILVCVCVAALFTYTFAYLKRFLHMYTHTCSQTFLSFSYHCTHCIVCTCTQRQDYTHKITVRHEFCCAFPFRRWSVGAGGGSGGASTHT